MIQMSAKCVLAFQVEPIRHMPSSSRAAPCACQHPHIPFPLHHKYAFVVQSSCASHVSFMSARCDVVADKGAVAAQRSLPQNVVGV
eukprot:scaffold83154_cov64-Phaeocystis_antarctica.AAC.10